MDGSGAVFSRLDYECFEMTFGGFLWGQGMVLESAFECQMEWWIILIIG